LLDYVEDLNSNRITAAYSDGLLASLTHSDGHSLQLAYIGGLVQSVTDPYGRVTTFTYDGAQHLTSATYYGTSTVFYTYSAGQGAAREHALTSISYPCCSTDYLDYDIQGRLIMIAREGGITPFNF